MELLRITRQIHCKAVEQRTTLIHRQYNRDWVTSYSRPPIDPYLIYPPVTKSWRRHCLCPWLGHGQTGSGYTMPVDARAALRVDFTGEPCTGQPCLSHVPDGRLWVPVCCCRGRRRRLPTACTVECELPRCRTLADYRRRVESTSCVVRDAVDSVRVDSKGVVGPWGDGVPAPLFWTEIRAKVSPLLQLVTYWNAA